MKSGKEVPLARGLLGGEVSSIYGQLEVFLTNFHNTKIIIKRKPYIGKSDIKFSVPANSLQSMIDILCEAKEKLDALWLSNMATQELKTIRAT